MSTGSTGSTRGTGFDDAAGLERVTATLGRLPAIRADRAADRIVAAALRQERARRTRRTWAARAAALLAAAGLGAGGVWYGRHTPSPVTSAMTADATSAPPGASSAATGSPRTAGVRGPRLAVSGTPTDESPVDVTFTLRHAAARRVAVVGDFDGWSPSAEPMARNSNGSWTAVVPITPGRHAYAFVVDDTLWVTDPGATVVRDPDYGRDHSVLVVGRP